MKKVLIFLTISFNFLLAQSTYPIVDTGQEKYYNNTSEISSPSKGSAFYGQDAGHDGTQPSYKDNGDGTVTDLITGLMWQKSLPETKYNQSDAASYAENSTLAGYDDWRLPTTKELYSLIMFYGRTGMSENDAIPYLDTDYFDFRFGGTVVVDERYIDAQYATSTIYKGTTMNGNETMFGVNFVDGRIKGYPTSKLFEIKMVRGSTTYGKNEFVDNNNGTISDNATNLMWDKAGSSEGENWEEALAYVVDLNNQKYLGYDDWRLPNIKELHSIVDYERSPSYTNSAAISEVFEVPVIKDEGGNDNYPFYWSSTTHDDGPNPNKACYVCFGEALGFMEQPPNSGNYNLQDVHGAGAQRSDNKVGDPNDYPYGHGPQGDVIRIYNYVRAVRDISNNVGVEDNSEIINSYMLNQNYPNPFNPTTKITFKISESGNVKVDIYNTMGEKVKTLVDEELSEGTYTYDFDATNLPTGVYLYRLQSKYFSDTKKMLLVK